MTNIISFRRIFWK